MPTFGVGDYRLWQDEEEQYMQDAIQVYGKFFPDTGVSPTGLKGKGITSVTWIATGHLRLTLDDCYKEMTDCGIGLVLAAAAGVNVTLGAVAVNTAPATVDLWINDSTAGTAADIAADAGNMITVDFEFQNSVSLVPG